MSQAENIPDETKFEAMQAAAQAAGPEAEDRRQEMGDWAQNQGALAENASQLHNESVDRAVKLTGVALDDGTDRTAEANRGLQRLEPDVLGHAAVKQTASSIKNEGVVPEEPIHGDSKPNSPIVATRVGVRRIYEDGSEIYRSPATIAKDNKTTEKAA